jgi:hypothetical protein
MTRRVILKLDQCHLIWKHLAGFSLIRIIDHDLYDN